MHREGKIGDMDGGDRTVMTGTAVMERDSGHETRVGLTKDVEDKGF